MALDATDGRDGVVVGVRRRQTCCESSSALDVADGLGCVVAGGSFRGAIVINVGRSGALPTSSGSNGRCLVGMMKGKRDVTRYQLDYEHYLALSTLRVTGEKC